MNRIDILEQKMKCTEEAIKRQEQNTRFENMVFTCRRAIIKLSETIVSYYYVHSQ